MFLSYLSLCADQPWSTQHPDEHKGDKGYLQDYTSQKTSGGAWIFKTC
jgi:hypothetical protein